MTAINRILIVDDEDNVRRMLSTAFALQGFETHCANNGRTALHLFADIHPGCGVDGYPHARDGRHQGTKGDAQP